MHVTTLQGNTTDITNALEQIEPGFHGDPEPSRTPLRRTVKVSA